MTQLAMKQADYNRICAQALKEYVEGECCGMMTYGREDGPVSVHVCENIQDKMHKQDPERFPRTNRNAYLIDPGEQHQIISQAEGQGGGIAQRDARQGATAAKPGGRRGVACGGRGEGPRNRLPR